MISRINLGPIDLRSYRLPGDHRLAVSQRDLGVGGDHLRHLAHGQRHRAVKVVGPEIGNHLPADVANLAVRQNAFQAVAHLDAALVVVHGQQDQHAAVRALAAHLPLVFKRVGKVRRIVAIQRRGWSPRRPAHSQRSGRVAGRCCRCGQSPRAKARGQSR